MSLSYYFIIQLYFILSFYNSFLSLPSFSYKSMVRRQENDTFQKVIFPMVRHPQKLYFSEIDIFQNSIDVIPISTASLYVPSLS